MNVARRVLCLWIVLLPGGLGTAQPASAGRRDIQPVVPNGAAKRAWEAQLKKRVGKQPPAVINLYNTWTHEYVVVDAKKGVLSPELADRVLRCHYTNETADMDDKLVFAVLRAARKFGSNRVDIVSGYRAPKYNLMLRKKGHEVARDSQHTHGDAIDFRLRGVAVNRLHAWAKALGMGGVGLYTANEFIHIDTGRVRYWGGE